MQSRAYPVNVVIGRIVVETRNHFLAREVERIVEESGLPEKMSSGKIKIDDEEVEWVLLPSPKDSGEKPNR